MDPKQKLDVVVTIDIGIQLTQEEFVDLLAREVVTSEPFLFETIEKEFKLTGRKFYARLKSMPELRVGTDIVDKPAKLTIGC